MIENWKLIDIFEVLKYKPRRRRIVTQQKNKLTKINHLIPFHIVIVTVFIAKYNV